MPFPRTVGVKRDKRPVPYLVSVKRFFELIGIVTFIWLMGLVQLSVLWVHATVLVYVIVEWFVSRHQHLIGISQIDHKKNRILSQFGQSNTEPVAWLNKLVSQMWPSLSKHMENILKSQEAAIRENLPPGMKSFKFINVRMSKTPPRFQGVNVYPQHQPDRIFMDLLLDYSIGGDVKIFVNGCAVSVKDLTIKSPLRLVLKCDPRGWPYLSWAVAFFTRNPELKFKLENCSEFVDIPSLKDSLRQLILSLIADSMVLPNQLPVYVASGCDENSIKTAEPEGVVRVTIVRANDLISSGKSKRRSDTYVVTKVGTKTEKTRIADNLTQPQWDQTFDFMVDSTEGQEISLDVYDMYKDKVDVVGKADIPLTGITERGFTEEVYKLDEAESGNVHIKSQWFWLSTDPDDLVTVQQMNKQHDQCQKTAVLLVYLDSAGNLPKDKYNKKPSAQVLFKMENHEEVSKVVENSTEPCWQQSFRFLVCDPVHDKLQVEITDSGANDMRIGGVKISLKNILEAEDMEVNHKAYVTQSEPRGFILIKFSLKILTNKRP